MQPPRHLSWFTMRACWQGSCIIQDRVLNSFDEFLMALADAFLGETPPKNGGFSSSSVHIDGELF